MTDINDLSNLTFATDSPAEARTLPAEKLFAWIQANRKPVRLLHAIVAGAVDLSGCSFDHELTIHYCTFQGHVDVSDARFAKSLDLRGCAFEDSVDLSGCRTLGSVLLTGAQIRAREQSHLAADFGLLRTEGNFDAEDLKSAVKLIAMGLRVGGNVDFTTADITGGLDLEVAVIEGSLNANDLVVRDTTRKGEGDADVNQKDGTFFMGGVRIAGQVSLRGADIARDLILYSSEVRCGLRCGASRERRTRIGGDAVLGAARFQSGVDFSGALIEGELTLEEAVVEGRFTCDAAQVPPPPGAAPSESARDGWQRAEIRGDASLRGVKVSGPVRFNDIRLRQGLNLSSAELKGGLFCRSVHEPCAEFGGGVTLAAARVWVLADLTDARVVGDLNLQNAVIEGDLFCDRLEILPWSGGEGAEDDKEQARKSQAGNVLCLGVKVSGQVAFDGARIAHDLNLQSVEIKGGLFCRPAAPRQPIGTAEDSCAQIGADLVLAAAAVAGGVHLNGAQLHGNLLMEAARVEGGLFGGIWEVTAPPGGGLVSCPLRVEGDANLATARVAGMVNCNGAQFGKDLNLQSADLRNGLFCQPAGSHRSTVRGSVLLPAAKVSGEVNFGGASIGSHFNLEGAVIDGKVCCQSDKHHRTQIGGSAALGGVKVSGAVTFNGAVIGDDLNLRGAIIDGKLTCQHAEIVKRATLGEIKVSGQIDFSGTTIQQDLSLQGANIEGTLTCQRTHLGGKVDLGGCSVRHALLDFSGLEETARKGGPAYRLEGFHFQQLRLGEKDREDAADYLALLRATEPFEVTTWMSIERWLRNQGKDEMANDIYLAMRAERRKPGRMFLLGRFVDLIFDVFVILAMRYKLLFALFAASLVLTTLVFLDPASVRPKGAHDPSATAEAAGWDRYEAFWMSVQINLPMTHIPVADKWEIADRPIQFYGHSLWLHYDYFASVISLLGYMGVPLFISGVAGTWLRKKVGGD
jgi:hypothetical protein